MLGIFLYQEVLLAANNELNLLLILIENELSYSKSRKNFCLFTEDVHFTFSFYILFYLVILFR
jgi:hypothetical protein